MVTRQDSEICLMDSSLSADRIRLLKRKGLLSDKSMIKTRRSKSDSNLNEVSCIQIPNKNELLNEISSIIPQYVENTQHPENSEDKKIMDFYNKVLKTVEQFHSHACTSLSHLHYKDYDLLCKNSENPSFGQQTARQNGELFPSYGKEIEVSSSSCSTDHDSVPTLESPPAAENDSEASGNKNGIGSRDVVAQATVDSDQSELVNLTLEFQAAHSQLNERSEQLQRAEAQLNDVTEELHHIQAQLDDRTNQIQQMTGTCESQVEEISHLKEQVESLRQHGIDRPYTDGSHVTQLQEPHNHPNLSQQNSDLKQREKKVKGEEATIKQLTEMNFRWQKFYQKKVIQIKKCEKEIEELKAQIRTMSISSDVLAFTEAQQDHIDGYYQRIRREADRVREEQETALAEAQAQFMVSREQMEEAVTETEYEATVARQQRDEALEATRELQRANEALNGQVTSLTQDIADVRAELVDIRGRNHQASPDQRLVNNAVLEVQVDELGRQNRLHRRHRDVYEGVLAGVQVRLQEAEDTIHQLEAQLGDARQRGIRAEAGQILAEQRLEVAMLESGDRDRFIEALLLNIQQRRVRENELTRTLARAVNANAVHDAQDENPQEDSGCCVIM